MKKYSGNKDYKVIAYCISRFQRTDQMEYISCMCKYAEQYHCKVMVFSTLTDLYYDDINDNGEKQIFSIMDMSAFDAVVIMAETFKKIDIGREIADRAIAAGVPVISVDRQMKGCINIDFRYSDAFEKIVRHIVVDHGCRKVNYIGGDDVSKFSKERFDVYQKVLAENGIPFEEKRTGYGFFRDNIALEVLDEFLKEDELPEAIICANDTMAIAVIGKLKALGIKVPEDVKVTGFDGIEIEKYNDPRLTTAVFDREGVVKAIYETALMLIDGKQTDQVVWVSHKYQEGHSCGCSNNHVLSAAEKLFDYQVRQGMQEDFFQKVINICSKTNRCDDFVELIHLTNLLVKEFYCKEYWLCFREDIWNKIIAGDPTEDEVDRMQTVGIQGLSFWDEAIEATHVVGEKVSPVRSLSKGDLISNLPKVLERENQLLFIPLHLQGLFIGYIGVAFDPDTVRFDFLNTFCQNLRSIIESFWSRTAQEQLMMKDELTNLYNNKGLKKKIGRLFAENSVIPYLTLIVMDIENLKLINDCYGNEEGDQAIRQLANFINQSVVDDEICARTGGDEFAIVTMSRNGRSRAQEVQDFIERRLADYNLMSGKPYELKVSFGSYGGENVDQLDYEMLDSQADKELYLNKQNNRNRMGGNIF